LDSGKGKQMKRNIFAAAALLLTVTGALFAKDNLAILPFSGGVGNEGETIAERLSFDNQLMAKFGIMPRTGIASAIKQEQRFQTTSGMTDADTIAALGAQLGAKYVMAGSITALGSQKLLIVSIVRIETIQQVAGDYLTYNKIEELPAKFSTMMKTLLPLLDVDTSKLPKLAVLPVLMQGGATNQRDADTLAQILAIYLLRNKGYAIYPRTSSLEKVQEEFKIQQSGVTADKKAAQSGYGVNPEYVLSVASRKLGETNMFNAAIIGMAAGTMADGVSEKYGALTDGIKAMESIAKTLSAKKTPASAQVGKAGTADKANLAILPFSGGVGDEGDAIAEILSFDKQLMTQFGIMPRTGIANAIKQEQRFQTTSGMTDVDTIAALGAQLGAKYVMAGNITALGSQKLVVVTIVRIETIQQVAGNFLTYTKIDELPEKVPGMTKTILPLLNVNTSGLPKLAVLPVLMEGGATNQRDADTLAQILAIYLLRNKGYAIYPRTSSLEKVQEEFKIQQSGVTADKNAAQLGYGVNPEYVLSVTSRKLGEMNMFIAVIIDIAAGTIADGKGTSENYGALADGIEAMEIIAMLLSGGEISDAERRQREQTLSSSESAVKREEAARVAAENLDKFLWTSGVILGLQGGFSVTWGIDTQIFGEPVPSSADDESKDPASAYGGNVGVVAALRLGKYFAIQSGLNFNIGFLGPSKLEYTYLQVPVLLRADWNWPQSWLTGGGNQLLYWSPSSVFGGIAYNSPISASSTVSYSGSSSGGPAQTAAMTIPVSGIVGIGIKAPISDFFSLYADIRWTFDFGETKVRLADESEGAFQRSSFDFIFGFKFYIPFRRVSYRQDMSLTGRLEVL
jgi:TolB-like protein